MSQQLSIHDYLTTVLNRSKKEPLSQQQIGLSIQHLKTLYYFSQINDLLGTEYLIMLLSTIQTYILRESFTIIDEHNQHILIEGELTKAESTFLWSSQVQVGKLIDMMEVPGNVYAAVKDCKMLRIKKNPILTILDKKIMKLEREQNNRRFQLKKKFETKEYKEKRLIFEHIRILNTLGELDLQDLIDKSFIKQYKKGAETHISGEDVSNIGYIFKGKIKVTFNKQSDKKFAKEKIMTAILTQKQWICLQEHFCNEKIHSNGKAQSIGVIILWIPKAIFQAKFNNKMNYSALSRLRSMLMTKKLIFDRSFNTRIKNLQDLRQQQQPKKLNSKTLEKMYYLANKNTTIHFSSKQQTPILSTLMHKMEYKNIEMKSQPKLQQKICLFPDQYENNIKFRNQNYELKRLQKKLRNLPSEQMIKSQKKLSGIIQSNPQSFYRTIMMQQCAIEPGKKMVLNKTFRLQRTYYKEYNRGKHFNKSIFNNFKVPHFLREQDTTIPQQKLSDRMTITKYE